MTPEQSHDEVILEHYRKQAETHRLAPASTMADETTRALEVDAILTCLSHIEATGSADQSLLEMGCGNGYLLQHIAERFPGLHLTGADWSAEMVELAASRQLPGAEVRREDVRSLTFPSESYDIVVTERCLINLLEPSAQQQGIAELTRVLKPGGFAVLIEMFNDGLANLNRARTELGLEENTPPYHNRWFDKDEWTAALAGRFREVTPNGAMPLPERNFMSTHYFVSRVFYPAVTRREVLYNTEFVKFFKFLPPLGEFSPLQLFFLQKLPS